MPGILGSGGSVDLSAVEADIDQLETDVLAAQAAADDAQTDATKALGQIGLVSFATNSSTWTNMPAGETEFQGTTSNRTRVDLTGVVQARFSLRVGSVAGAAGAVMRIKYSTDGGSNFSNLFDAGGDLSIADDLSNQTTGWVNIASAARADVILQLFGQGGDAAIDPTVGAVELQTRVSA